VATLQCWLWTSRTEDEALACIFVLSLKLLQFLELESDSENIYRQSLLYMELYTETVNVSC